MRAALAIAVVVLGASGTGCFLLGELDVPTDRDYLFHIVAVNFHTPALCERINPRADGGGGGFAPDGHQITSLQASCYRTLAQEMHDPSLCDRVVAVRTLTLDGSKMGKADCLAGGGSGLIAVPSPDRMGAFAALLQSLGYGDGEVADSEYLENPQNSPTFAAYSRLRDEPEFLQRLNSAPSYQEPLSESATRSAYPIEFLCQLEAVERSDAAFCAKVSPNATFVDDVNHTARLQSKCYLAIAFNTVQAALCDPLPRAGSSRFTYDAEDSYEYCMETVATYSRSTVKRSLRNGPQPLPHAADFQVALKAIGYEDDFTSTLIPRPPSESYWEFVSRLRFRGSAADRAEFVRRVTALQ